MNAIWNPLESLVRTGLLAGLIIGVSGCAVHSYDKMSGTERLWGFGFMKVKVSPVSEGVRTEVVGSETVGLSIRTARENAGISLGYDKEQRLLVGTNLAVRLEWTTGDMFGIRAGTNFPLSLEAKKEMK